ncbi:hypothetical protein AAULR_10495 [Lacticaseibacillus rhamnosus MTCC 5462]|nr:hypothetical protein AAULR_10495 [Lacticaseibacillus rhamnosus MTCC 5462]
MFHLRVITRVHKWLRSLTTTQMHNKKPTSRVLAFLLAPNDGGTRRQQHVAFNISFMTKLRAI